MTRVVTMLFGEAYWPWWLGALALGLITFLFPALVRRPLGVSGSWERVLHWTRERRRDHEDELWADRVALTAALEAATVGVFGEEGRGSAGSSAAPRSGDAPTIEEVFGPAVGIDRGETSTGRRVPVVTEALFLIALFLGGLLAALASGRFEWRTDMGPDFASLVTADPWVMVMVLFGGGVLVGFGTRLAGGCSSGHGLSGCSRLHPGSLVATAVFFAAAAAMSTLLWRVI